jgi:uncharacterized membrane protein
MNIALWIVQGLLALAFIAAGVMKSTQPKEKLAERMTWVNDFSLGTVRFVGIAELLGGLGLILPWATGIATILTPLAASGLALTMVLAALYHLRKREYALIVPNIVLLALSLFVAIGRF